jgi:glutathione S-transferase
MGYQVAGARARHKIPAPTMDGPVEFQSVMRVQANTVEQFVLFLPALWMCAYFLSDRWAALGGAVWVVGRIVYALGYYKAPAKREIGFGITFFASVALMIGTVIGLLSR